MKSSRMFAASAPALKSVSSVLQTEPEAPLVCAVTEISDRDVPPITGGGVAGATLPTATACDVDENPAPRKTVSVTTYVPAAGYRCAGFCADDRALLSPKLHCHWTGLPAE